MFQQRPPELEARVPAVWTPPPRTCVQVLTASNDHEKAFSPVAGRVRLPERMPAPERKAYIKEMRKNFAAKERTFAQQHQTRPTSLDDLKAKSAAHLFAEETNYLVVPAKFAREHQQDLKFCSKNGALIAQVLDTSVFSEQEVRPLFEYLVQAMRINPETIPTKGDDSYVTFPAVHCVVSNRYSEHGDDAAGVPVAQTADELEGNTHQRLPREHLDIRKDVEGYNDVCAVLHKIFRLIGERIKESLPSSYKVLLRYIDELPLSNWSPYLEICVVITFGRFTGGELGLYEAKLLFELDGFSILIFPSEKFTHFNLPFQGERGSIALATEKASLIWTGSRNSWQNYLYSGRPPVSS
ncbi:hypothetical protein AURDEDRAFT_169354 [Auricularia subglabra TFB-10046 SS5]|nr:hypothetical protein AURDEDRAFT_169354 [Auricularia subglabra TFB-10046 SS5]